MKSYTTRVDGLPVAQPRAKAVSFGGHARVYNPGTANLWKACVIQAIKQAKVEKLTGAVRMSIRFFLPRPKSHMNSIGLLKKNAPTCHTKKPDLDNLTKAVMDAATAAGAWGDDSQVCQTWASKLYAGDPYAEIIIQELEP
jgi:Holliday junction resolvase RusA-like endonuclease